MREDPVTATQIKAGVSTMAAMGGTMMQAQAASANQSAQAKVANYNAQIETQLGIQGAQAGAAKEEQQRRANADIEGKQFRGDLAESLLNPVLADLKYAEALIQHHALRRDTEHSASAQDVMRQQRINDELDATSDTKLNSRRRFILMRGFQTRRTRAELFR